jgi:hypothetical protein
MMFSAFPGPSDPFRRSLDLTCGCSRSGGPATYWFIINRSEFRYQGFWGGILVCVHGKLLWCRRVVLCLDLWPWRRSVDVRPMPGLKTMFGHRPSAHHISRTRSNPKKEIPLPKSAPVAAVRPTARRPDASVGDSRPQSVELVP